ncbi:uncharacterized protein [Littorina saxatilis]|uniref:uncharacterized protein isoform X1 n=1 Tax=Littorina saxatilis TaxID=31220 RepID=UPI0038B542E2
MDRFGVSVSALMLSFLLWILTGVDAQFKVKRASSLSINDNRNVTCSPAHNLMIRTAHYLAPPSASESANRQQAAGCVGGDCAFVGIQNQYQEMTSGDVLKVYRHCQRRDVDQCDVSLAGVERDFEMSYFCLNEPLIDPCSNMTSEEPRRQLSFVMDYSHHTTSRDVMCQCTVDMTSSNDTKLYVRALNLFEGGPDKVMNGPDRVGQESEVNVNGRGITSRRGPVVLIDSTDEKLSWEVEQGVTPVEGQLETDANTSIVLLFEELQSITFGRVWIDIQAGEEMQVSCNFTSKPGIPLHADISPQPQEKSRDSETTTMIYISCAAASFIVIVLIVVAIIVLSKCRNSSRSRKVHSVGSADDDLKRDNIHDSVLLEGDYCTISEARNRNAPRDQPAKQPRERTQPISTETSFTKQTKPTSYKNDAYESKDEESTGENSRGQNHTHEDNSTRFHGFPADTNQYETLSYRPMPMPRSEPPIYDHAGRSGPGLEEAEYHHLQHGKRLEPKVIDNVYDTTSYVAKQ